LLETESINHKINNIKSYSPSLSLIVKAPDLSRDNCVAEKPKPSQMQ
jgi:hypothetical protein